jgi:DNA-binding winged helix-turn-helix (wHTH) protein
MSREQGQQINFGLFRLDLVTNQLWQGEQLLVLQPKPLAVLRYLAEHPRQVVTKSELLKAVWAGVYVTKAVVKECVRAIRGALSDDATTPRYIETVGREGYRFIGQEHHSTFNVQDSTSVLAPIVVGREKELG